MAIAFIALGAAASGSAGSTTLASAGAAGDALIAVFGFEGAASGSGPYITPSNAGWFFVKSQAPSGTGQAIEVWVALNRTGGSPGFTFDTSRPFVARMAAYRGVAQIQVPADVEHATSAQFTGNPSGITATIDAKADQMTLLCVSQKMTTPGYGTVPSGFTGRFDNSRASTFGNVEIEMCEKLNTVDATLGPFTYTGTAAGGSPLGTAIALNLLPTLPRYPAVNFQDPGFL